MNTPLSMSRSPGFTLIELIVVIVLLGALTATVVPVYTNLEDEADQASEDAIVGNIRSAISLYYAETALKGDPEFPTSLDSAPGNSQASESNPFFTNILGQDGVTKDWEKKGGDYIGPAGGEYEYDGSNGRLTKK
jgi:prepilin-type N-terminal cleavage/methylation domain-containing protein